MLFGNVVYELGNAFKCSPLKKDRRASLNLKLTLTDVQMVTYDRLV